MDDTLQELENELKRLRPRAPSTGLLARLEADLDTPEMAASPAAPARVIPFPSWLGWRTIAASAAVAAFTTVLFVSRPAHETPPATIAATTPPASAVAPAPLERAGPATVVATPTTRYQPVGAASVLYDLREDGKVNLNNRTPARRLRYRYVDTYTWKNPATNASLKWSIPRDEVRVQPASLH